MARASKILVLGQTPPPFHGQSVVTAMLFEHDWLEIDVSFIRMAYSDSISSVGRFSFNKVGHLFYLICRTWKAVLVDGANVLYYPVASANRTPVIRDIVYLLAVGWCFKKKMYHFHAGGLPLFLDENKLLGRLAKLAYGRPQVGIDVIQTNQILLILRII